VLRDGGICQNCGKPAENPHHVFYKTKKGSRWLLENGINLCENCHVPWAHAEPEEFMEWWILRVGLDTYLMVKNESMKIKPDLDEIEVMLKNEVGRYS
jgi:hypothetical protein